MVSTVYINTNEFSVFFYTFQDGVEVKPSKDLRIYAMGRKRFLQIMKCRVSDSGIYTCDAGDATTCCTVEVYGKVQMSKYTQCVSGVQHQAIAERQYFAAISGQRFEAPLTGENQGATG